LFENAWVNIGVIFVVIIYFRNRDVSLAEKILEEIDKKVKPVADQVSYNIKALHAHDKDLKSMNSVVKKVRDKLSAGSKKIHRVEHSQTVSNSRKYSPEAWAEPEVKMRRPPKDKPDTKS